MQPLPKILVIDDDLLIVNILKDILSKAGYQVLITRDGYSAVEITHKQKPDLIILDMMLPGGGGISILHRIKLSKHINQIPVVAITSCDDDELQKKAYEEGVNAYVRKPIDEKNLIGIIDSLIKKKSAP